MSRMRAPIVIVGAGCAGLSLAVELVERGLSDGQRVVLLDARKEYVRDRTWSFWNVIPHRFESAITRRYARWQVQNLERNATHESRDLSYCSIPSDAFYEIARERLGRRKGQVDLVLDAHVSSVDDRGQSVLVTSTAGDVEADWVFDSRPDTTRRPLASDVSLLQHFVGHTVELDRPAFDPSVATLMDFRVTQEHGIHFMYVLPESPTRALLESTFFTAERAAPGVYERAISAYARERLNANVVHVVSREEGVIPMTTASFNAHPSKRVHRIGLAGGFAKPSTGYAFLASQKYAALAANAYAEGKLDREIVVRDKRKAFLDAVFLSYLVRHPENAPSLFVDLFDATPPDVLIRFLSETSSPLDELRGMQALPTAPFAGEALRSRRTWMHRLFSL